MCSDVVFIDDQRLIDVQARLSITMSLCLYRVEVKVYISHGTKPINKLDYGYSKISLEPRPSTN